MEKKCIAEGKKWQICPSSLPSRREPQWSVPSFLYLESNIRLGNLDDSGFPSLDRGGIVIGMPRKEARGHRRPDSVDRGRSGEGGDNTDCLKKIAKNMFE